MRLLSSQRDRWHRGLADVIWRYRHVFFNRRYGPMGLLVYPYFFFVELLSPVLELVGLVTLVIGLAVGAINGPFAALFFAAAYGYGMLLTMLSLLMEEIFYHRYHSLQDRVWLITWTILENFGLPAAYGPLAATGSSQDSLEADGDGAPRSGGVLPSPADAENSASP